MLRGTHVCIIMMWQPIAAIDAIPKNKKKIKWQLQSTSLYFMYNTSLYFMYNHVHYTLLIGCPVILRTDLGTENSHGFVSLTTS